MPCYLGLIITLLSDYFITDSIIWTALVLTPYIIWPDATAAGNGKYLWWSISYGLLVWFTGIKTFYFLSLGLAILYAIESSAGHISYLGLFQLGLLSPTFKYFNHTLGFPVRLKLTAWVGDLLRLAGYRIVVNGNVLVLNGTEFSVDPGCVGLKMMTISMLAGLLIMVWFQRQRGRSFSFTVVLVLLVLIAALNIAANLIRIVILTLFRILPENPLHDITGILCFLIYVILPSYFLIKWVAEKFLRAEKQVPEMRRKDPGRLLLINLLLFAALTLTGFTRLKHMGNNAAG